MPPLDSDGKRILELRGMRVALGNLIDPGTICRAFENEFGELTWFDLQMLADVETELKSVEEPPDGEGR